MGNNGYKKLLDSLRDKAYRHLFSAQIVKRGLAEQIRETRLERGWTQAELAQASGKKQETISQLENPDYGNYTLKTLQRLAESFDVALIVRFIPFSELARWITDLSPEDLAVPDFEHDLKSETSTLLPADASMSRYSIFFDFDHAGDPPHVYIFDEQDGAVLRVLEDPRYINQVDTWSWDRDDWQPGPFAQKVVALLNADAGWRDVPMGE